MTSRKSPRPRRLSSIDLLVPELFASEGGIQVYSRNLIRALQAQRPELRLRVFIRNDRPHQLPPGGWPGISFHAASGSTLRMAWALLAATGRRRSDLLLSTHPNFAPLQLLHHWLTGIPSWASAHGIDVWDLPPGPTAWSLARLQALLPVSRFTAERLRQKLGRRCPPLLLLPNSFDATRFTPGPRPAALLQRHGLQPDQPLILTLSRLSRFDHYKNIDALIKALPALLPRWPGLRLMVAGEGNDRQRLQQLAQGLGLGDRVLFPGLLPSHELVDYYRLATLFALPSEKEGFGIVFLEAMGCGLPTLAGNRDGSCDPLADGDYGLLVDPRLPLAPALGSMLAGQGRPLWFDPPVLSAAVGEAYGFSALCTRLEQLLASLEQSNAFN
jgi:glycosyltransferase involved in cell wall biosynthesis